MTTKKPEVGPWGFFAGPGDLAGRFDPGALMHASRLEREAAKAEREEAEERASRAEARLETWKYWRMQEMVYRGQQFDPNDLSTMVRPIGELADEIFARQDAEAARAERKALIEAGLLADLGPRWVGDELPTPSEVREARAAPMRSKIRAALARWSRPRSEVLRGRLSVADDDLVVQVAAELNAAEITGKYRDDC
jgi:hypothetical protein